MESSASSPGVIAREKLKIFQIFRDVGPEGEDILKTAKLVHVADKREAFVVTMEDETYSFVRTRLVPSVCKIAKIPQLCGLRVKEFAVGMIELAITEDGFLYSWIISDPDVFYFEPTTSDFALLGRLKPADKVAESNLVVTPHRVLGSLAGKKVHQVALSYKRIMALTWGGEVHQWGGRTPLWTPTLVPKQHFHYQQVISITCSDDVSVALTSNGELFQWELDNEVPQKIDVDPTPFKKITAGKDLIFALTVNGALYSARLPTGTKPIWSTAFEGEELQDVFATCWTSGMVIFELKNCIRFAFLYHEASYPDLSSFSQSGTSIDEYFAGINQATYRTVCAETQLKPGTVADHIGNLWASKENSDVTFSLEGKTISAHKCILACRSEYFAKMFNHDWKEVQGSVIEIKDIKYGIFEAFLFYIYNDEVTFGASTRIFLLADSYCDLKIRQDCEKILIRNINEENAFFLVRNSSLANASDLERNVVNFILDKRLLDVYSSSQEIIDLLGMETFHKISMASLHRV